MSEEKGQYLAKPQRAPRVAYEVLEMFIKCEKCEKEHKVVYTPNTIMVIVPCSCGNLIKKHAWMEQI